MILVGGIFTTNSLLSLISLFEYRVGLIPNPIIGGSEQLVPAHAKVIILGFSIESTQVTRTTGQGNNAVEGFFLTFISLSLKITIISIFFKK